jgi:hypothetical protein
METEQAIEILRVIDDPTLAQATTEKEKEKEEEDVTSEPPLKKQKISNEPDEVPAQKTLSEDERATRRRYIHHISMLMHSHPELNIAPSEEEAFLHSLSSKELEIILESSLIKTGGSDIFTIPKMGLLFLAKTMKYKFGLSDLTDSFSRDTRLQHMIQEFIPGNHWTVGPLSVIHRIWHHIEGSLAENNVTPRNAESVSEPC